MRQALKAALLSLAVLVVIGLQVRCGFAFTMGEAPVHEFVFSEGHRHYVEGDLAGAEKLWVGIRSDGLFGPVSELLLAKGYVNHGDPDRAIVLLKRFLDNHPSDRYADMARKILVDALCKTRNIEAADLLKSMAGKASAQEKPRLIYLLARLHRHAGNHQQAAQYYRTLFLEYPASVEGLKASTELAWMVVNGKIPKPTFSRQDQLARAERLFREGRFDLAGRSYRLLLAAEPSDVNLMLKLARCRFRDRQNKQAIKELKEILQKKISRNDRLEALYLLSRVYWRIERNRKFELCCAEILDKGSPRLRHKALFNLGAYHYERGKLSQALDNFNRLVSSGIGNSMKADAIWKIAWIHYRTGKFTDAAEAFRRARVVSRNGQMDNPSRYWQARSLVHLGKTNEAKALFKQIAENSPLGYYGQESVAMLKSLGAPIDGNHSHKRFPDVALSPVQLQMAPIAAAKRLMDLDLYDFALANLVSLPSSVKASPPVAFLMATAAYGARQYKTARSILAKAFGRFMSNPPDDAPAKFVEMAFPRVHRKATVKAAKRYGVDPHLVWAVVRQESQYDATAVSPAGALGLMQVTPQAAGLVGKHGRIQPDAIGKILEPKENIITGIHILAKNLHTFKGRTVPAIASYNADVRKVRDWMKRNGSMRQDEFIENIPYLETRIYVKKVLAGYRAYSMLHKKFDLSGLW